MTAARLDTITAIPSARPKVPAPDSMIPGFSLPRVATYEVRRPFWLRPPARNAGFRVGGALACLVPLSLAIAQILTGGAP